MLELPTGPTTMFATSALVDYPEEMQSQAVRHIATSWQNQRTWTVGVTVVSLGLVVMLAAGLIQLARSPGRFARYVGVPVLGLVMLPGLLMSGRLLKQVLASEESRVPSPFHLQDTLIDSRPAGAEEAESEDASFTVQFLP